MQPSARFIYYQQGMHARAATQVATWKRQAIDGLTGVFSDKARRVENNEAEVKELHAKIGKLSVENDFLSQGLKTGDIL